MCRAFPDSDYYEGSVTLGVSPLRPSRVPLTAVMGSARLSIGGSNLKRSIVIKTLLWVLIGVVLVAVVVWLVLAVFGIAV